MTFFIVVIGIPTALAAIAIAFGINRYAGVSVVIALLTGVGIFAIVTGPSELVQTVAERQGWDVDSTSCTKTPGHYRGAATYRCVQHSGGFLDEWIGEVCLVHLEREIRQLPLDRCPLETTD
jgi:hypothetical protein